MYRFGYKSDKLYAPVRAFKIKTMQVKLPVPFITLEMELSDNG
jgi:hypothetical protein